MHTGLLVHLAHKMITFSTHARPSSPITQRNTPTNAAAATRGDFAISVAAEAQHQGAPDEPHQKRVLRSSSSSVWGMRKAWLLQVGGGSAMLCLLLLFVAAQTWIRAGRHAAGAGRHSRSMQEWAWGHSQAGPDTLVIYTYSNSDSEYERNLRYFVEHGMRMDDGCQYLIIVQEGEGILPSQAPLPELPYNAVYLRHVNECYDWGTFGWALGTGVVDPTAYRFIIFLNSSSRGPFLPAYWPPDRHWSRIFTQRLSATVKLVGSTISCEAAHVDGDLAKPKRQNPHVQSYAVATDQEGLRVLMEDGHVFGCYASMHDTIWHAEVGSSLAILAAGYTIDSLMLKYSGADWRDPATWGCNAGLNPYAELAYDGIDLNPLEVLFVKVKGFLLQASWVAPTWAQTYDRWQAHQGDNVTVASNIYAANRGVFRRGRIAIAQAVGSACFDHALYRAKNPDLAVLGSDGALFAHYVEHGQFEGRTFRFTCMPPGTALSPVDGNWFPDKSQPLQPQ